jgi:hypothetical protein
MNANQSPWRQRLNSFAVAAFATSVCMGAQAEYLCNAPPSQADKRACELAKLDRPDELRHFIQRTRPIYGLSMADYVTEKDVQRWDMARRSEKAQSIIVIDVRDQSKSARR